MKRRGITVIVGALITAVLAVGVLALPMPYVVLKPGNGKSEAMAQQLQEHVKNVIAPYKYPRAVEFVDALPRTETGKLQRFKLRSQ